MEEAGKCAAKPWREYVYKVCTDPKRIAEVVDDLVENVLIVQLCECNVYNSNGWIETSSANFHVE